MSIHALSDRLPRRPKPRSAAPARQGIRKKVAAAVGRNNLVADFLAVCQLDPAVDTLAPASPATFLVDGRKVEHTADFEIVRDGEAVLVDVVPEAELARHPLRAALADGQAMAEDGRRFMIETAASLRAEPRFTTVRLIMECRRMPVSAGDRVRILHHLDESGRMRRCRAEHG